MYIVQRRFSVDYSLKSLNLKILSRVLLKVRVKLENYESEMNMNKKFSVYVHSCKT